MKKSLIPSVALLLAGTLLNLGVALGQRTAIGNWTTAGNDAGHSGWQKAETKISKESAAKEFKFLWKIKLGQATKDMPSFTEPLLALRLINAQGFKDLVLWGDTNTVYAVDSELGTLVWKKSFDVPAPKGMGACGARNLSIVLEAPQVINFGARRAPGAPAPPPPPPPPAPGQRRLGVPAGGGGFALKGVYVLTGDGYLHEQVLTTGVDYAPAVKFIPTANANPDGLNISGKTVFTTTRRSCGGGQNALWSIDLASPDYPVRSYSMQSVSPLGLAGPTIGEGVAYVVTGSGVTDSPAGVHANSIVSVTDKELKVKDWYTPSSEGKLQNVTPVAFTFKQKKLVAAPGKDGSFVLLDNESLGGADHHTPLAQTTSISKAKSDSWNSFASWQDLSGTVWVLASVSGPVDKDAKFENINGPATHGSIVAFKVEEKDGRPVLTPSWISRDLINPASPVIANGVVIALSEGDVKTHAKLYVLDAITGKELYSSGDEITTYAHLTGVSVGDGHAFFTTHDNTLYSFGIAIEH
ncbi:MAG: pyrrolo-quinoline quinone [Edaphobacter sp.]|nr:pyrrolo-quinoline quinone [Edaphobacter sp.]